MQTVQITLSVDENQDQARVRVDLVVNGEPVAERDAGPTAWKAITGALITRLPEAEAAVRGVENSVVAAVKARSAQEAEAEKKRVAALSAWGVPAA